MTSRELEEPLGAADDVPHRHRARRWLPWLFGGAALATVLVNQVRSPLVFLLIFAAAVSAATGQWSDAIIVGARARASELSAEPA